MTEQAPQQAHQQESEKDQVHDRRVARSEMPAKGEQQPELKNLEKALVMNISISSVGGDPIPGCYKAQNKPSKAPLSCQQILDISEIIQKQAPTPDLLRKDSSNA